MIISCMFDINDKQNDISYVKVDENWRRWIVIHKGLYIGLCTWQFVVGKIEMQ